jgi:type IV pilus assembly protein PilM
MRSRFASWFTSSPPTVGVEIGARRVTAVSIGEHGGKPMVSAHATETLPEGLVAPALNQPNIADRAAVSTALGRVLSQIGGRPGRVALVVPDGAAKVSLVKFDKVPPKAEDLAQLIRWQVKKTVPFPLEQAQVTWTRGATDAAGGVEFVVAIARRDIIEEYEAVCQAANAQAGLVDLATLNLINLALLADPSLAGGAGSARGAGRANAAATAGVSDATDVAEVDPAGALPIDWLLVHVGADSSTVAIVRGAQVLFFRNRPSDAEGHLNDLVHQSAMYYEDRLGGPGFSRVLVTARDVPESQASEVEELYRGLAERSGDRVEVLDPRGAAGIAHGISPSPELLSALAAPVGVVLRET